LSLEETPLVSKSLNSIYKSCIYWDNNNQAKNTQSSIPENPEPSKLIPQDRIKRFNKNPKGNTIPEYIEDETHACNSSPTRKVKEDYSKKPIQQHYSVSDHYQP
jgi:hypothetical protein